MMTHPIQFFGSIAQYWAVIRAEYNRLSAVLGKPPFTFMFPPPETITEYAPKRGDEIMFTFLADDIRTELLVVEAAMLPDQDPLQVQIMVHPQGDPFQEPVKSAMTIWSEIKSALERAGGKAGSFAKPSQEYDLKTSFAWYHQSG